MSLRIRRGLSTDRVTITPEAGEFLYDTDTKLVYIGDGTTLGGNPIGGGITDGDKGDITVSGSGSTWTIDNLVITDAKINDVAWSKITGVPLFLTSETDPIWLADKPNYLTSAIAASTYQPLDGDLSAIAALAGTSGLLRKTALNTFTLDTATYLTSFTETDPTVPSFVKAITNTQITNWDDAFSWGNHASAGYLTSFVELDPVFLASPAATIFSGDITNWNDAYGWGNHNAVGYLTPAAIGVSVQGYDGDLQAIGALSGTSGFLKKTAANTWTLDTNTYLTSFTETDPIFTASDAFGIASTDITNWNISFGWGNHASVGYLTSATAASTYVSLSGSYSNPSWIVDIHWSKITSAPSFLTSETDPLFSASPASGILAGDITNWNSAYSWGNHALVGYLTSFTELDPVFSASPAFGITGTNITNWNTAFSWGNHASVGYLTSFTETDPTVAAHIKAITNTQITNWDTVFGWGNHATAGYLSGIGGTNTQVQYNNGGSLAGAANVEIENDVLRLENISSTTNPAAGGLKIYSKNILGGFNVLVCQTPDGQIIPLQPSLFLNKMPVWVGYASGTTAPTVMGATVSASATMGTAAPATTNAWTKHQRKTHTTAATAGSSSGIRQPYTQFSQSVGGFLAYFKFGQTLTINGEQKFIGMCASTSALAGDASALVHMIGMGVDAANTGGNWYLMHNDGSGVATIIDLGANAARNITDGYELIIYVANGSNDYYVYIRNIATNTVVYNGVVNTNIPGSSNQMAWKVECRNGAVAAATNLHVAAIYIQPL